ncbi:MAG: hypothetical protein ABIA37_01485 [Candidatus Woesearchaeota archaeon]
MSKEGRDVKAAEQEFMELFKSEHPNTKPAEVKKEQKGFLSGFLRSYHRVDRWTKGSGASVFDLRNFTIEGRNAMFYAVHPQTDEDKKLESFNLGQSLGYILGVVELGLTAENYGKRPHPWSQGNPSHPNHEEDAKLIAQILAGMEDTAKMMKQLGKKVRTSFLKRRVLAMSRNKKLTEEQKELIAKIAAIFV